MLMRTKNIISLFFLFPVLVASQTIHGTIIDKGSHALPYISVTLLSIPDSAFVMGCVTNKDGYFYFESDTINKLISISGVGYEKKIIPATQNMEITIFESPIALGEVYVKGKPPTYIMKKGLLVSRIEGTVYSKLGRAMDVIQQLPLMTGEGLSVIGRGAPLVYINNRKMRNMSELERLTSDMIKEVKLDLNPGAKYPASTRAVLHITTTRSLGEGIGGHLIAEGKFSKYFNSQEWLDVNYRNKKMDLFINTSFSHSKYDSDRHDTYLFQYQGHDMYAEYDGKGKDSSKNGNISVGFNYQMTNKQYFGATYQLARQFSNNSIFHFSDLLESPEESVYFDSDTYSHSRHTNQNLSLYYENQFHENWNLKIDGTYIHFENNRTQDDVEDKKNTITTMSAFTHSKSDMWAVLSNFTTEIGDGELGWGIESSFTRFHQNYAANTNMTDGFNTGTNNESKQVMTGIYLNYIYPLGKYLLNAGIRYEYVDYKYYTEGKRLNNNSKSYHYILPALSVSFQKEKFYTSLGYSIETKRPNYSDLDGSITYINSIRYFQGNPLLKSTYNHNISFLVSYRDLQFLFDYTYSKDDVVTHFDVLNDHAVILSTNNNLSYSQIFLSITYSPHWKFWHPSFNIMYYKQWLKNEGIGYTHPQFVAAWKNMFVLSKNWMIVLNMNGNLKGNKDTYMAKASGSASAYVQKRFKNFWMRIGVSDIFNSRRDNGYSMYSKVYTTHRMNFHSRYAYVTLSYTFNPTKSRYKGKTAGQSEIDRL